MVSIARKAYMSCGWESPRGERGFDLTLEAYVRGPLDVRSGLVVNLTDLDKILKDVIVHFDHKHLQKDYPHLRLQSLEDFATHCFIKIESHPSFVVWGLSSITLERIRLYYDFEQWIEVQQS